MIESFTEATDIEVEARYAGTGDLATIRELWPHVEAALFGKDGIAEGLSKGKIVVDMSSIAPIETQAFAKKINDLGCEYVDGPVSGGEVGAKGATLTIMCGGKQEAFDKVKPLFELMGKNITLVGEDNGAGQTCKIANQIIVGLNIAAVT